MDMYIVFIISLIGIFLGIWALFKWTVRRPIEKAIARAVADLEVFDMHKETWDGNPNNIIYAWQTVRADLCAHRAPLAQIEAAERAIKECKHRFTYVTILERPERPISNP